MDSDRARGAVALITNARGELLLHLRDDIAGIAWPGHWSFLGGGCEPGESPHAAVVRELSEEAGLTLDDLSEFFEITDTPGSGQLITVFTATWEGDAGALPLTEGVELAWIPPEELGSLPLPLFVREAVRRSGRN